MVGVGITVAVRERGGLSLPATFSIIAAIGVTAAAIAGAAFYFATLRWIRTLRGLTERAAQIVEHDDFSVTIDVETRGELGRLADTLRKMVEKLRGVIGQLQQAGLQIGATTEQLLATAREHETGAAMQLTALSDTSSTTQRLADFAQQIATEASSVASTADRTLGAAQSGQAAANGFSESVVRMKTENAEVARAATDLAKKSQQIQKALATINAVADRADVLALNAELEGAKAGEVGRGFSLVAAEVRRMAESTLAATRQIEALIDQIAQGTRGVVEATERGTAATDQGVLAATAVTQSLLTIVELAGLTNEAAQSISSATSDQESGTAMLVAAMGELVSVTERGLKATQQTSKANQDLSELARRLKEAVERFRIDSAT